MKDTLASAPLLTTWHRMTAEPVKPRRRANTLATLRDILAIWEERMRRRWELAQMSSDNPHLIDDIGLTARQVEIEIAKPFWQV